MADSRTSLLVTCFIRDAVVLCALLSAVRCFTNPEELRRANRSRTLLQGFYRGLNAGRQLGSDSGAKWMPNPSILDSSTIRKINGRVSSLTVIRGGTMFTMAMTFNLSHVTSETLRRAELHLSSVGEIDDDLHLVDMKVEGRSLQRASSSICRRPTSAVMDITKLVVRTLARGRKDITAQAKLGRRQGKFTGEAMAKRRASGGDTAFLVTFSERKVEPTRRRRLLRSLAASATTSRGGGRSRRHKSPPPPPPPRPCGRSTGGCLCRRHDLTVDLSVLGWDDRVVYPAKFNAFYCAGRCPTLIGAAYSPTNHAILQNLYRLRADRVPRSRCVPIKLRPLSMLYYENRELVHRRHEDMVVVECGCR